MAGATNKSAKRLGYTKGQIQTERAKGGVLSHAALMASGEPARPTKAYKALAEAMAERKKGLTRSPDAINAERERQDRVVTRMIGERTQINRAAKSIDTASRIARGMRQKQATAAKGGNLDLRKQTERRYELTQRLRAKTDDLREARRSAMNSGDDARVAKLDSQIKRMTARADRADEGWTRMGTALNAAPAEKRQQWEAKAERAEKRKALIARTAQNLGGVANIARGMRQKMAAAQPSARGLTRDEKRAKAREERLASTAARALGQRDVRRGMEIGASGMYIKDASPKQVVVGFRGSVDAGAKLGGGGSVYKWDGKGYRRGSEYLTR